MPPVVVKKPGEVATVPLDMRPMLGSDSAYFKGHPLMVPVEGVEPRALTDTYHQSRSGGRIHMATDILAMRGGARLYSRLSPLQMWAVESSGAPTAGMTQVLAEQEKELAALEGEVLSYSEIKAAIEKTTSDYDREKLQERLAKLSGGVAIINVGAATETELKEKKARVEDALHATRAAVEEGIVPGGGVALIRAQSALEKIKGTEDEKIGVEIVRRALEEPIRMIAQNAGAEGSIVVARVKESKDKNFGYNAATDVYEDLVKAGVIDPTKVTRTALQNAASIAGLLLTTECVVVEKKEDKPAQPPGR